MNEVGDDRMLRYFALQQSLFDVRYSTGIQRIRPLTLTLPQRGEGFPSLDSG